MSTAQNQPPDVMASFTLRLPPALRSKAEEAAAHNGHTLADELRQVISSHYADPEGFITLAALKHAIRSHEQDFHCPKSEPAPAPVAAPAPSLVVPETHPHVRSDGGFEFSEEEAGEYLIALYKLLSEGHPVTPSDLAEVCKKPSRRIGRILGVYGVKSKNTRISGVSGRYYLPEILKDVEKCIPGLRS